MEIVNLSTSASGILASIPAPLSFSIESGLESRLLGTPRLASHSLFSPIREKGVACESRGLLDLFLEVPHGGARGLYCCKSMGGGLISEISKDRPSEIVSYCMSQSHW